MESNKPTVTFREPDEDQDMNDYEDMEDEGNDMNDRSEMINTSARKPQDSDDDDKADDYDDVINDMDQLQSEGDFTKFNDKERLKQVYQNLDDLQKERFEAYRSSAFDEKKMKKILTQISGTTGKLQKNISAILRSVTKIYVGQLVEEARKVQLEETKFTDSNGNMIQATPETIVDVGPIQPHHLQEARRRLMITGELIPEKPKSMFLRR